jgi:ComF family protein
MRSVSTWTRAVSDAVVSVLLSPVCAACRAALEYPSRGAVCAACWRDIPPLIPPLCECCGDALRSWRVSVGASSHRCVRCREAPPSITRTGALGTYDGSLRAIIHALKYARRRSLGPQLSGLMQRRCSELLAGADMAVPVPLHLFRRLTRGFNQAEDLCAALGLPISHALTRARHTSVQADLPAISRYANVKDAFQLVKRVSVHDACIVLVDDVSTTGATLEACAQVLLAGGAREVRALIAARAVWQSR